MATTDAQKVPITITSRSQIYTFKLADPSTMFEHLKKICKNEKINIEDDALKIIVKRGGGSYRDSLSILDQVSTLSDDKISADLLNHALGLPQEACIAELLTSYETGNIDNIRKLITELTETGVKSEVIASELIDAIMVAPSTKQIRLLDKLTQISPSDAPNVKAGKLLVALCANTTPIYPTQPVPSPIIQKAVALPQKPNITPKPEPIEEPVAETPKVTKVANDAGADEIWQAVVKNVAENSPLITGDLFASKYTLKDKVLTIYTGSYLRTKNLDKRRNFITEILPDDISLVITKETLADDPDVANIAAIMGGGEEIQIDD
jgi:DNA polymerase-3 subunit gamma/tau